MEASSAGIIDGSQSLYSTSLAGSIRARPFEGCMVWTIVSFRIAQMVKPLVCVAPNFRTTRYTHRIYLDERGVFSTHSLEKRLTLQSDVAGHIDETDYGSGFILSFASRFVQALCSSPGYHATVRVGNDNKIPLL